MVVFGIVIAVLMAGLVVAVFVSFAVDVARDSISDRRRNRLSRELLKRAKLIGPVWYCNFRYGVTALCRADELKAAYSQVAGAAAVGKRDLWRKVILQVIPTFTFARSPEHQNFMQIGNQGDFDALRKELVEIVTGIRENEVSWSDFTDAKEILVPEHEQLFVPFSTSSPSESEIAAFGARVWTMAEARSHLFKGVPVYDINQARVTLVSSSETPAS